MPKIELLECVEKIPLNATVQLTNGGNANISFSGENSTICFRIGKNIELPLSQLIFEFDYISNAFGAINPYIIISYNDVQLTFSSVSNTNGSKIVYAGITNTILSEINKNIRQTGYDHLYISFSNPYGTISSFTTLNNFRVYWNTSRSETFQNYETKQGASLQTYSGSDNFPIQWNQLTTERFTFNPSLSSDRFLKINFSEIDNEAFDITSRAIVRVTGSNNLSVSGVNEKPAKLEVYGVNENLSQTNFNIIDRDVTINQQGEVFVWGTSNVILYSGNQANDIELCFIDQPPYTNNIGYSASKPSRDHKSLFKSGDFYIKGLSSGYQINNIELFLYSETDKYVPFGIRGGDNLLTNSFVRLPASGYVFSRKLLKEDVVFWNCSVGGSGTPDPSGTPEPSGLEPSGTPEPPPL